MRSMRMLAAAAVLMLVTAGASSAQCLSEVRQLSPHSFNHLVAGPVAYTGSMFALASIEERTGAIWVSLYSEEGDLLYSSVKLPSTEGLELIDIVWNGVDFAVFYRTEEDKLAIRRVNTTGEHYGNVLIPLPNLTLSDDDQLDIFWSTLDQAYIIGRTSSNPTLRIWLTYVTREGAVKRNVDIATPTADSFLHLAMTPSGTLGVFYKSAPTGVLTYLRVRGDERPFSRELGTAGEDLLVTIRGEQFVLAQTVFDEADERRSIEWRIIDTDGFEVSENKRLLVGTGEDVDALSLVALPHEFAIMYLDARDGFDREEGSLRLRRFDDFGETISDTLFAVSDRTRHRAAGDELFWTGSSYFTVATRTWEDDEDEMFLIHFCPLKAIISAPRTAVRGSTVTFTAIAEGGDPEYDYDWEIQAPFDIASGRTFQRTFTQNGDYTIRLTVEDRSGAVVTQTFTITIFEPENPKPPRRRAVRKG